MNSPGPSYHGYRFPAEIISHAVWLYHRFSLSFRDVEDLLATPDERTRGGSHAADADTLGYWVFKPT